MLVLTVNAALLVKNIVYSRIFVIIYTVISLDFLTGVYCAVPFALCYFVLFACSVSLFFLLGYQCK